MREVVRQTIFKRDAKRMQRQGKKMELLGNFIALLACEEPLPFQCKDHPLKGDWKGSRELHIAPDWLLIYHLENNSVFLERTGSHAELFES